MNDYITLDGYKYRTPARNWAPAEHKPASVKTTLLGEVDATYGPTTTYEWRGEIAAPVTSPGTGWGTIADLRLSLKKRSALSFSDHYGVRVRYMYWDRSRSGPVCQVGRALEHNIQNNRHSFTRRVKCGQACQRHSKSACGKYPPGCMPPRTARSSSRWGGQ